MSKECLICQKKIEYLKKDEIMECEFCHKKEASKVRCVNNHYVCNECHTKGVDNIISICLKSRSKDPIHIIQELMNEDFCHMHGPEHHIMVACALLTAYKNSGGKVDFKEDLLEIINRTKQVPGGTCGFWGACGAGISSGIFISVITKSNPLTRKEFSLSNQMTSQSLKNIAEHGGPRCCKRDSFLSILTAIDFVKEKLGVEMIKSEVKCDFSDFNNQCLKEECIFYH